MRPIGEFVYFLSDDNGSCIAQVKSGVEIKTGDEINFNGNKLLVKLIEGDVLIIEKIGHAIIVENFK